MSSLKYRLQQVLPSLSVSARSCRDKEIKERYYFLKTVATSSKTISRVCRSEGSSRSQFYKWGMNLVKSKKIESLKGKSRKPKRSPNKISPRIEKKIVRLRKRRPFEGPERITDRLSYVHSMHCPASTVYAVLKRNHLISKEYKTQGTKKHMKRYRRELPGFIQMDFKYVPYRINGEQYYQLSAVDHCTTWRMIRVYKHLGIETAKSFLDELNHLCPFPIFQIQTDNDVSFTDKFNNSLGPKPTGTHPFDEWCRFYGCRHKLIPVGQKELNGKVENTHKWDDKEFFSQITPKSFEELEQETRKNETRWNQRRRTKALGWKTPNQALEQAAVRALAFLLLLCDSYGVVFEKNVPPPESKMPLKKIKPLTIEDRYLLWIDWETAQYPKYSFLLYAMSRIFSLWENTCARQVPRNDFLERTNRKRLQFLLETGHPNNLIDAK